MKLPVGPPAALLGPLLITVVIGLAAEPERSNCSSSAPTTASSSTRVARPPQDPIPPAPSEPTSALQRVELSQELTATDRIVLSLLERIRREAPQSDSWRAAIKTLPKHASGCLPIVQEEIKATLSAAAIEETSPTHSSMALRALAFVDSACFFETARARLDIMTKDGSLDTRETDSLFVLLDLPSRLEAGHFKFLEDVIGVLESDLCTDYLRLSFATEVLPEAGRSEEGFEFLLLASAHASQPTKSLILCGLVRPRPLHDLPRILQATDSVTEQDLLLTVIREARFRRGEAKAALREMVLSEPRMALFGLAALAELRDTSLVAEAAYSARLREMVMAGNMETRISLLAVLELGPVSWTRACSDELRILQMSPDPRLSSRAETVLQRID